MKSVKFLNTAAGTYGVAQEGDKLTLKDNVAAQLEKQGTVKILGDAGEDEKESVATSGSVRITEGPKQGGNPAKETDEKEPTKEKNSKAGPNGKKK